MTIPFEISINLTRPISHLYCRYLLEPLISDGRMRCERWHGQVCSRLGHSTPRQPASNIGRSFGHNQPRFIFHQRRSIISDFICFLGQVRLQCCLTALHNYPKDCDRVATWSTLANIERTPAGCLGNCC